MSCRAIRDLQEARTASLWASSRGLAGSAFTSIVNRRANGTPLSAGGGPQAQLDALAIMAGMDQARVRAAMLARMSAS